MGASSTGDSLGLGVGVAVAVAVAVGVGVGVEDGAGGVGLARSSAVGVSDGIVISTSAKALETSPSLERLQEWANAGIAQSTNTPLVTATFQIEFMTEIHPGRTILLKYCQKLPEFYPEV